MSRQRGVGFGRRLLGVWMVGLTSLPPIACTLPSANEDPAPATLELGGGITSFEPLEDGDPAALIAGSQGGHHVWLSLRAQGLDPERVELEVHAYVEGGAGGGEPIRSRVRLQPLESDAGDPWHVLTGYPVLVWDPACAVGRRLHIEVTLTDRTGRQAMATLRVTVDGAGLTFGPCGERDS